MVARTENRASSAERRARFVAAYLASLNATQAAIEAGYSAKTARSAASRLLTRVDVNEALARAKVTALTKASIDADRVIGELKMLAFSSIEHYTQDETGKLVPAEGAPPGVMAAVEWVKYKTYTDDEGGVERTCEFKLHDKLGSLKLAGRHVGLFPSKDQEAIEAAADKIIDKRIETRRRELEAARALAENREAERERIGVVDVVEAPKKSEPER
jgi:phage terminase small subunit